MTDRKTQLDEKRAQLNALRQSRMQRESQRKGIGLNGLDGTDSGTHTPTTTEDILRSLNLPEVVPEDKSLVRVDAVDPGAVPIGETIS